MIDRASNNVSTRTCTSVRFGTGMRSLLFKRVFSGHPFGIVLAQPLGCRDIVREHFHAFPGTLTCNHTELVCRPPLLLARAQSQSHHLAAILAIFRVVHRYVGNLPPMPGAFPNYPAPVIRNTQAATEMTPMRWGVPPPPRAGLEFRPRAVR